MVVFKSIVVLDLETTSLPKLDHNTTKITELAFIGCEIEHLVNAEQLPRVLHKLVLLFNPYKLVTPEATRISGLSNELLVNVQPFRQEDVEVLRQFINRLPSPVCLVAHNGDKFDFPILRRAMINVNKDIQNNVYCVDSIKAFQSLLPVANPPMWTRRPKERNLTLTSFTPNKRSESVNSLEYKKVSRELFPDDEALSEWASSQEEKDPPEIIQKPKNLQSFKLQDIYKYYFGSRFLHSHRAEEDSKALLSCIIRCGGFLEWMNNNAIVFNSIEPLL